MADTPKYPWRDGGYKATNFLFDSVLVAGHTGLAMGMDWEIKSGDFGETEEAMRRATGQKAYNIQTKTKFGHELVEPGVVSSDGLTMWVKTTLGVGVLEWCTEEEWKVYESSKEPVEAPSHPYRENPGHLGKFLWITGAPGLGKSTVAQLLAKKHGFIFYEGDCFMFSRNPFLPANVEQPTLAQFQQKPLRGAEVQERQKLISKVYVEGAKFMTGEKYDEKIMLAYIESLVTDLKTQRARIGGDWAVAGTVQTKKMRDHARKQFGPNLQFIVLDMELEQQVERIRSRHGDDPEMIEMQKKVFLKFEPKSESEENTVAVKIAVDMTPDDLANNILREINKQ